MCLGPQLPLGVPVPQETFDQYPSDVKAAWETFHAWLEQQTDWLIPISAMTPEVVAAQKVILAAPIPGYPGKTGVDTCYMIGMGERLYTEGEPQPE